MIMNYFARPAVEHLPINALLAAQATKFPDRNAYVFLCFSEGCTERSISFSELHMRASSIAARLVSEGVAPGDRVMLLFPSGIEFIENYFGCLCAGAIAVPVYPPLKDISALSRIVADCSPKIILSCEKILERLQSRFRHSPIMSNGLWRTPGAELEIPERTLPLVTPDHVAMLQYTSGSTSDPKGVVLTHGNLTANLRAIKQRFNGSSDSRVVSWLPLYHDMGLIGGVLGTLYCGATLYFMSPQDFAREPFRWLDAISRYRATISGAPNFAYQLAISRTTPQQISGLDLTCWQVAFNGAEPIRSGVLEKFAEKFFECGFDRRALLPCYGMAEASVLMSSVRHDEYCRVRHISKSALQAGLVTGTARDAADAQDVISCGEPIDGHIAKIVDPQTRRQLPDNKVGEIWISGPSVASRYWNAVEDQASAIDWQLDDDPAALRYHRTGDLGFIQDKHLYVVGRLKDLIILHGKNYSPQDIELVAAESHASLELDGSAAFEIDRSNGPALVLVQEVRRSEMKKIDPEDIARRVRSAIADHFQIEIANIILIGPRRLPRTSSGKVQRSLAKRQFLEGTLEPLASIDLSRALAAAAEHGVEESRTPLEKELCEAIAEIVEVDARLISCIKPLHDLNIDSLSHLRLTLALESTYGYGVSVEQYFDGVTIRDIARKIGDRRTGGGNNVQGSLRPKNQGDDSMPTKTMQFSLMFFSSDSSAHQGKYDLVMQCAKYADQAGLTSVWLPERHFHRFGGLYPNPSVLAAALAVSTSNIRLRAGSVISPLQNPIRIAEEWSIVDNLSDGRVDLAFGQGWNPNDFVLAPDVFEKRLERLHSDIRDVRTLWSGGSVVRRNGIGNDTEIRIFPAPVQKDLNIWITCSGGKERFEEAGASGANILTAMLFQNKKELEEKLKIYREARSRNGFDPKGGHVTLMLHTFLGEDASEVREIVRPPLMKYLEDSIDLWGKNAKQLSGLGAVERRHIIEFAFERYFGSQSLCGTVEHARTMVTELQSLGVDEIACLVDFGAPSQEVLRSLKALSRLNRISNGEETMALAV
jgi:natural product biosynthesis luciferase-like monooxygenase protein